MAAQYELRSRSPTVVAHQDNERPWDPDVDQLERLGKQPVWKVSTKLRSLD